MAIVEIRERFMEKYSKELETIFNKYDMDMGVCVDILIAWFRNLNDPNKLYVYDFDGSENVNLEELAEDIKILEDNLVVPKLVR